MHIACVHIPHFAVEAERQRRPEIAARLILIGETTVLEALADPKAAWFAIKNAVTRHSPERPVEELEIELVGLSSESAKQAPMLESNGKLWRQVEEAARHLHTNGRPSLGRIVEVEPWSRIPERRAALEDFAS